MEKFSPASLEDATDISTLVNSAYRGEGALRGWTTEASLIAGQRTDAEMIADIIRSPSATILIRHDRQACVELERKGDVCYLGLLTVHPSLQSRGIGSQALAAAEDFARKAWGSRKIEMNVISVRAELIAWYQRRGYSLTQRTAPFPYGADRFGIPLRDGLEFRIMEKAL